MKTTIEDLRKLLEGVLSCDEFKKKMKVYSVDIQDAIAAIDHYLSDEDIRSKEAEYKLMQENELRKLISLLEKNAPESEVAKISFLVQS